MPSGWAGAAESVDAEGGDGCERGWPGVIEPRREIRNREGAAAVYIDGHWELVSNREQR